MTAPAATWRDWLTLTKPKVIALLLFTATATMCAAARGLPDWLPLAGVLLGGAMCSGGAGVFNMALERDIDARMKRTARRPLVTGVISLRQALCFGSALSIGALVILWLTTNPLTTLIGLGGLAFYVLVYTVWLKRRTWQNIVIGGAAGAMPPLLGHAALVALNLPLLLKMVNLQRKARAAGDVERAEALALYKFSMLYLALVLDRSLFPTI